MNKKIVSEILKKAKNELFMRNLCFYLYDLDKISSKIETLEKNLPKNVSVFYSVKANPHKRIIEHMKNNPYVKGVEIASLGELKKSLKYFLPAEVIFAGPGKTVYELREAMQKRIGYFAIESFLEALRIQKIAEEENIDHVNALVRVNIKYKSSTTQQMSGISSKLGIDEEIIFSAFDKFSKLNRIKIKGIHAMAGCEELNYQNILEHVAYVFELVKRIEKNGFEIEVIDFGGGFGIDYSGKNKELDIELFGKGIKKLIGKFGFEKKTLIFELGKYLAGESGYYVTEIVDMKGSRGKKHIITAGGINHQKRPHEAGTNHPMAIIPLNKPKLHYDQMSVLKEAVDIGGPLCTSLDIIGKGIFIEEANIGDLVVIENSGAYSLTFSPVNFLSHPLPKEYFIKR